MQRPPSVTVFGILNIFFGLLGACSTAISAMIVKGLAEGGNAGVDPLGPFQNPIMIAWVNIASVLGIVACVVLFIGGIGLLMMRRWGRALSLGYAIYGLVATLVGLVMNWFFLVMPLIDEVGNRGDDQSMFRIASAIGGMFGGCIGLIFPALLWYFMTRPHVVAAFAGVHAPPPVARSPIFASVANESRNPYVSPLVGDTASPTPIVESVVDTLIPSKNGAALTAYYLGLFSLFPCVGLFLGIAAVYYGLQGLANVRRNPEVRGGIHAWVGLVCGALFGLFNLALALLAVVGFIGAASGR